MWKEKRKRVIEAPCRSLTIEAYKNCFQEKYTYWSGNHTTILFKKNIDIGQGSICDCVHFARSNICPKYHSNMTVEEFKYDGRRNESEL